MASGYRFMSTCHPSFRSVSSAICCPPDMYFSEPSESKAEELIFLSSSRMPLFFSAMACCFARPEKSYPPFVRTYHIPICLRNSIGFSFWNF